MDDDPFDWLLDRNRTAAASYELTVDGARPARRLAVVTCLDTRIDPLTHFGLALGDAKVIRNAGARVTDDVVRSVSIVCAVLGVDRVAVIHHSKCAMASVTPAQLAATINEASGGDVDPDGLGVIDDHAATLRADLGRLRAEPSIPAGTAFAGFVVDLDTGLLERLA